jgi:opacity protein-like surface antigen
MHTDAHDTLGAARPSGSAPDDAGGRARPARWRCGRAALVAAAACACAATASAADWSIGVGAGGDRGRVDCVASFPCDRSAGYAKLFAGYRPLEPVEVQLVFFDAGSFKGGDTTTLGTEFGGTFKVRGVALTGGYRWDLTNGWSVMARAGIASVHTHFEDANAAYGGASENIGAPIAGLGVAYAVTPSLRIGVDYDATRFKVHTTRGSLQMLGAAAQFSF